MEIEQTESSNLPLIEEVNISSQEVKIKVDNVLDEIKGFFEANKMASLAALGLFAILWLK
ncbi:MAG: hypothetical protein GWP19_00245 [Planctomycetia bacterium]|nr:hypothetical protein [Planctomycetia bacterium]